MRTIHETSLQRFQKGRFFLRVTKKISFFFSCARKAIAESLDQPCHLAVNASDWPFQRIENVLEEIDNGCEEVQVQQGLC